MSAPERIRLAGAGSVLALAGAIALVLAALLPQPGDIAAAVRRGGDLDAFSIAYLEALARSSPEDARDAVLEYARSLAKVGRYAEALAWLGRLRQDPPVAELTFDIDLDYARALGTADPKGSALLPEIRTKLEDAVARPLSAERRERLAKAALEWGWPAIAARHYRRLAESDGENRANRLREAARWHLAAGEPRSAAQCYQLVAEQARDDAALESDLLAAAAAYEAGGDVVAASTLTESYASRLSGRGAFLRRALALSLAANRAAAARALGRQVIALRDASDDDLRKQLDRELSAGDAAAALAVVGRLIGHDPENASLRRLEALLAERTGNDFLAFRDWARLAL